ncbi:AT-rich interactive domain-containing protein 5A, partial [Chaetura pelagica]
DTAKQGQVAKGGSNLVVPRPSSSGGCPGPCHPQPSKRLFSSFYSKGNHPITSPLAKKKLLAQVTKAESLHCHKHPSPEPPRLPTSPHLHDQRSLEPPGAQDTAPNVGGEVGPIPSVFPGGKEEEGAPAPTIFTGCFQTYPNEVVKPTSSHPFWGCFKDFLEPTSTIPSQAEELEQPQDLRRKAWSREQRGAGATPGGCWVPPRTSFTPVGKRGRREEEEVAFGPTLGTTPPSGRDRGLAKPKAVVANPGYSAPAPPGPDVYTGAMLYFPASFGNLPEHLKTQGVPVAPSLSANPLVIPVPLVATSPQSSELCRPLATGPGRYPVSYGSTMRHRIYPERWHHQPPYTPPTFHHHTKL